MAGFDTPRGPARDPPIFHSARHTVATQGGSRVRYECRMALADVPLVSGAEGRWGHSRRFDTDRFGLLDNISREVGDIGRLAFPLRHAAIVNSPATIRE